MLIGTVIGVLLMLGMSGDLPKILEMRNPTPLSSEALRLRSEGKSNFLNGSLLSSDGKFHRGRSNSAFEGNGLVGKADAFGISRLAKSKLESVPKDYPSSVLGNQLIEPKLKNNLIRHLERSYNK